LNLLALLAGKQTRQLSMPPPVFPLPLYYFCFFVLLTKPPKRDKKAGSWQRESFKDILSKILFV
jgi:hypothetical protein